ncbi:purple acid phosphatase family protein [Spirosoma oryzicola]|uniref:purple acid phosphatase family protein n=1 Tax=Spirosoma oryzicola TaxID=2898794 RepID=UPI001E5A5D5D|nr:metallophosphoesterase family protein [Spirosoma oryzicola]UHG89267.1 metallophosphoesterase family protein [Spirosoma oryzicola]
MIRKYTAPVLWLVCLFLSEAAANAQTVTRSPYLQVVTPTSITVRWRTDQPTTSRVRFGANADQLTQAVSDPALTTEHVVTLTGLQAATRYFYAIGTNTNDLMASGEQYFQTSPTAGSTVPVRIWALGDFGSGTANQFAVLEKYRNATKDRPADIWLWLGDNAYNQGYDSQYQQNVFNVYTDLLKRLPVWPTPGNHEYVDNPNNLDIDYFRLVNVPQQAEAGGVASGSKRNYSFDYANIHFVSLDSQGNDGGRVYDPNGRQAQWLVKDLAANRQPWTIVFFHHPPYTKGSHDSDNANDLIQIRQQLLPILEQYQVDLVLSGHSHLYERSYLMKGHYGQSTTFDKSQHAVSTGNARYDGSPNSCPIMNKQAGTIYVVNGSGGQLGWQSVGYPHPAMVYSDNQVGGSMVIDVTDNRLDAQWVAADGVVRDKFTVLKKVNQRRYFLTTPGKPLTLTASWPGNYTWSSGQTGRTINVAPTASATYTVTDQSGCLLDAFAVDVDNPTNTDVRFEGQLAIYPNVATGSATIKVAIPSPKTIDVHVTDSQGVVMFEKQYVNTAQITESITLPASGEYRFIARVGTDVLSRISFRL